MDYIEKYEPELIDMLMPVQSEYALVVVNLNGFKGINDTYGHKEADKLLVQIAENLKQGSEGFGALVAQLKKTMNSCCSIQAGRLRKAHLRFWP